LDLLIVIAQDLLLFVLWSNILSKYLCLNTQRSNWTMVECSL